MAAEVNFKMSEDLALAIVFLIFMLLIIGCFVFMAYKDNMKDKEMYNKCIDTCERVFIESKLITCIQVCNEMKGGNETNG